MRQLRYQAHRGDSAYCPENTIPAFASAVEQGYDVIEMDTKFTKDGVCVLLHDRTLNRTARRADGSQIEGEMSIADVTLEEAREFDYGLFKGEQFRGTRMSTLSEGLAFLKGRDIMTKLDNVFESFTPEQFEVFCCDCEKADMEEQLGFTCKTLPYLNALAKRFPKAELHYDGELSPESLTRCGELSAERRITLWIPYDNECTSWFKGRKADAEFCRALHEYGEVGIWLINEPEELDRAYNEFGADIIETNGFLKPNRK